MTILTKTLLLSTLLIVGSLSLYSKDKKPHVGLQVEHKLKPKLKKYATECTVDFIQDIVPTDSVKNGSRLKDQRNIPEFIRKDSKTYNDKKNLKARGEVKKLVRSSMRSNENHQNLPEFVKKDPSLGLLGEREYDNLLDRVRREPDNMKRIVRFKKRDKVKSTKRVHGETLGPGIISINKKDYSKPKKDGTLLKARSISKTTPRLGRMLEIDAKLPRTLPRSTKSFTRSNILKAPNHTIPKESKSINHCK